MEKSNDQIRRHSDAIGEEVRRGKKQLDLLLRNAKKTLEALNVPLLEEAAERESPICLPDGSLSRASAALAAGSGDTAGSE